VGLNGKRHEPSSDRTKVGTHIGIYRRHKRKKGKRRRHQKEKNLASISGTSLRIRIDVEGEENKGAPAPSALYVRKRRNAEGEEKKKVLPNSGFPVSLFIKSKNANVRTGKERKETEERQAPKRHTTPAQERCHPGPGKRQVRHKNILMLSAFKMEKSKWYPYGSAVGGGGVKSQMQTKLGKGNSSSEEAAVTCAGGKVKPEREKKT